MTERLSGAEHLALGPLGADAIGAIAALYAPGDAEVPVADLAERSGGVPQRAHRLAADWARARAARRLRPVADRTATERSDLRRAEIELAGNVVELQAVRERAELHEADHAAGVCPFKGLSRVRRRRRRVLLRARAPGRRDGGAARRRAAARRRGRVGQRQVLRRARGPAGRAGGRRAARAASAGHSVLLRPGEHPMADAGARDGARPSRTSACSLAVDQFEETFTLCRDEAERAAFVDALVAAARARARRRRRARRARRLLRPLRGVPGAGPADGRQPRPRRTDAARRAAARDRAVRRSAPACASSPSSSTGCSPTSRTSPARCRCCPPRCSSSGSGATDRRLRLAGYERTGGVRGAVARLAEAAYERLDPRAAGRRAPHPAAPRRRGCRRRRRPPARRARGARRRPRRRRRARARRARRAAAWSRVGEGTAEVAHEALLREWPRLRGWLEQDAEGRRLHRHLAVAAREWSARGRDPGELYRGARLAVHARLERRARAPSSTRVERAFIDASRAAERARGARARGARTGACGAAGRRRRAAGARRGRRRPVPRPARRGARARRARPRRSASARRPSSTQRPRPLAAARAPGRRARGLAPDAQQPACRAVAQPGRHRRRARRHGAR